MNSMPPGGWLVILGLAVAAVGLVMMSGLLDWFGHLPGDIRIERGRTRLYVPITSMLIVSVVLSVVVHLVRRFLG